MSHPRRPRAAARPLETPHALVLAATRVMFGDTQTRRPNFVLDPSAGDGRWALAMHLLHPQALLTCVERQPLAGPPPAAVTNWVTADFLTVPSMGPEGGFDAVVGAPPLAQAAEFVRLSHCYLAATGRILFLLPLRVLSGVERGRGFWREYPPDAVFVCSSVPPFDPPAPADPSGYALFYWSPTKAYHVDCDFGLFDWDLPMPELVVFRPKRGTAALAGWLRPGTVGGPY